MDYQRLKDVDIKANLGNRLYLIFIVKDIAVKPQKNNQEFMGFTMVDRDVSYDAKIFGVTNEQKATVTEGRVYAGTIDVKEYAKDGKKTISCICCDIQPTNIDPSQLADWVDNLDVYVEQIGWAMNYIDSSVYGEITRAIITKYWPRFSIWPAASSIHHTQLGGLLFHTATVVQGLLAIAQIYMKIYGEKFLNIPLMVAGALLHDVMKTVELDVDAASGANDYSSRAALLPHIIDIVTEVDRLAIEKGIVDTEEINLLKHIVAAHHGRLEYGSPIAAAIPEAYLLSKIDDIDAEMWKFNKGMKDIEPGKYVTTWAGGEMNVKYKEMSKA